MSFHSLRFDRAAASYGGHAIVQRRMAETLLALLPSGGAPAGMVEMGCGTGLFTRGLRERFPDPDLIATDAAPRMLDASKRSLAGAERVRWELFEASGTTAAPAAVLANAPFFLAASNALVQWFPDLERHFAMVHSLLSPGGAYLVSGFARDNFPELNALLKAPPFGYADFPGHERGEVESAAAAAGFSVAAWREESIETVPESARAFLDSIKALGSARRPDAGRPLTRERLRYLVEAYRERFACEGGVKATWKPWYARIVKPA